MTATGVTQCKDCGVDLAWGGVELVDVSDGAPHRLTCPVVGLSRRWLRRRRRSCEDCGVETEHVIVSDRRDELQRCTKCGRSCVLQPLRRLTVGRAL